MTVLKSVVLIGALAALAACQPATTGPTTTTQTQPQNSSQAWEHWYSDANGLTKTETSTTDWQLARVAGPNNTTLVVQCNGNDPTGYHVSIENAGEANYPPMAKPYDIEVFSRNRSIFVESRRPAPDSSGYVHSATTDFASAMRQGSYMVFKFQGAEALRFTLKGSARVMDRLNCDPNLL